MPWTHSVSGRGLLALPEPSGINDILLARNQLCVRSLV